MAAAAAWWEGAKRHFSTFSDFFRRLGFRVWGLGFRVGPVGRGEARYVTAGSLDSFKMKIASNYNPKTQGGKSPRLCRCHTFYMTPFRLFRCLRNSQSEIQNRLRFRVDRKWESLDSRTGLRHARIVACEHFHELRKLIALWICTIWIHQLVQVLIQH